MVEKWHDNVRQKETENMTTDTSAKLLTKQVIITTERRGVFFGDLVSYDPSTRVGVLDNVVMAMRYGTTKGLLELADTGPTSASKLSATAPRIRLELCECVIDVSEKAGKAWNRVTQ